VSLCLAVFNATRLHGVMVFNNRLQRWCPPRRYSGIVLYIHGGSVVTTGYNRIIEVHKEYNQ